MVSAQKENQLESLSNAIILHSQAMTFLEDLKSIYDTNLRPIRGETHAERMEFLYSAQIELYDKFRDKLLKDRKELIQRVFSYSSNHRGKWIDLGAGTGQILEFAGNSINAFDEVLLLDLSQSMLNCAEKRVKDLKLNNVTLMLQDQENTGLPSSCADVVTLSYSLSIVESWRTALNEAFRLLKPGGIIGLIDFYISADKDCPPIAYHTWLKRVFWRTWSSFCHLHLDPAQLPTIIGKFKTVYLDQREARLPYFYLSKMPYFIFIGSKESKS